MPIDRTDRDWWKRAVFYQIYPRSFQDSNGDGVGDLAGIARRLDHLAWLGVDAVWISPFYRSPMADFGYDVTDYCDVDPIFGTLADFDRLVEEAHARDIRVVIDFVPNHTSDRHPWFRESRSSRANPKRDWYVWADSGPDGGPPNNWRSNFLGRPAWTLDQATGQYYLHSFLAEQPDLNWWNPAVRTAMKDALRFWLDRGVDGFRIDVAHLILKDPDLGDDPPAGELPRHSEDWEGIHEIYQDWRRLLDSYGDRMMVGEVFILDPGRMVRYYGLDNDELELAFNFSFLRQPWSAEAFKASADLYEAVLPPGSWPDYTLSNHDNPRARSRYDEPASGAESAEGCGRGPLGLARARVAALMLLTLRGTPFVYYGEEIGQADGEVPRERIVDVDGRDPERTPMQWQPGPGAGFTTGDPWLPVGSEADRVNVALERDDPASMLSLYRRTIEFRRGSEALLRGAYRSLDTPPGVFAYLRDLGGERVLVALNFVDAPLEWDASRAIGSTEARIELSTTPGREGEAVSAAPLRLAANEGLVLRP